MKNHRAFATLMAVAAISILGSAIRPADWGVWAFELSLGIGEVVVLAALYRRFRFSGLVYLLVAMHVVILAAGAKYTYAEVPLGHWLRETLHLARNPFDRVGHFAQGFVPAILVREVLLRATPLARGKMLAFLTVCVCLAFSAAYELLEWGIVGAFYPTSGPEWLGMQGDPWDTQEDMAMALCGATLSLLLLSRVHDRSMESLKVGQ